MIGCTHRKVRPAKWALVLPIVLLWVETVIEHFPWNRLTGVVFLICDAMQCHGVMLGELSQCTASDLKQIRGKGELPSGSGG